MSTKQAVLDLLEKNMGHYISGEEIGRVLNITRAGVWKTISALKEQGYQILSATNKGYTLDPTNDLLSKNIIYNHLDNKSFWQEILVFDTVGSTNDYAKSLSACSENKNIIVVSEHQTAGKGRLGRMFYSPAHSGIYLSFLMRPEVPISDSGLITSYAAVNACKAIFDITGVQCTIKWVNDLYLGDKKVCGILTEGSVNFELSSLNYAVIGIGINIFEPENGFDENSANIATSIISKNGISCRNQIIAKIADSMANLGHGDDFTSRSFLEYYRTHSYVLGKDIYIIEGNIRTKGTAISIDDSAGLVVKLENGDTKTLNSGEVSVRIQ